MDFVSSTFDPTILKASAPLTGRVRSHLTKVYQTLATTVLASAVGCFLHMSYNLGGLLSILASVFLVVAIYLQSDLRRKYALLMAFGVVEGISLGTLVEALLEIDPSIVTTTCLASGAAFACFSISAMYAESRTRYYVASILSSAASMLSIICIMNLFVGNPAIATAQLYMGLMLFCGFLVYDTQLIIAKADRGNTDYVTDALTLFLDLVQIFVRLAVILARDKKKKQQKN